MFAVKHLGEGGGEGGGMGIYMPDGIGANFKANSPTWRLSSTWVTLTGLLLVSDPCD